MKAKEMAIVLNVPKSQRGELLEVLDALTAEGKVEISGRGKYVKSEGKYLTGVFTAHPRGFGFVTVEGEEEDISSRLHRRTERFIRIPSRSRCQKTAVESAKRER